MYKCNALFTVESLHNNELQTEGGIVSRVSSGRRWAGFHPLPLSPPSPLLGSRRIPSIFRSYFFFIYLYINPSTLKTHNGRLNRSAGPRFRPSFFLLGSRGPDETQLWFCPLRRGGKTGSVYVLALTQAFKCPCGVVGVYYCNKAINRFYFTPKGKLYVLILEYLNNKPAFYCP